MFQSNTRMEKPWGNTLEKRNPWVRESHDPWISYVPSSNYMGLMGYGHPSHGFPWCEFLQWMNIPPKLGKWWQVTQGFDHDTDSKSSTSFRPQLNGKDTRWTDVICQHLNIA
jgi:hypothetical protein